MIGKSFGRRTAAAQADPEPAGPAKPLRVIAPPVKLNKRALEMANEFLKAKRLIAEFEKAKDDAKAFLIDALGEAEEGILSDGRRVYKTVSEHPPATINRKGYTSTVISIA